MLPSNKYHDDGDKIQIKNSRFYLDVDWRKFIIRMSFGWLLESPFIISVAWVSFVGLALSMGLELEHPLLAFHKSHPPFVVEAAHVQYKLQVVWTWAKSINRKHLFKKMFKFLLESDTLVDTIHYQY